MYELTVWISDGSAVSYHLDDNMKLHTVLSNIKDSHVQHCIIIANFQSRLNFSVPLNLADFFFDISPVSEPNFPKPTSLTYSDYNHYGPVCTVTVAFPVKIIKIILLLKRPPTGYV